jgi:hypothetical protein
LSGASERVNNLRIPHLLLAFWADQKQCKLCRIVASKSKSKSNQDRATSSLYAYVKPANIWYLIGQAHAKIEPRLLNLQLRRHRSLTNAHPHDATMNPSGTAPPHHGKSIAAFVSLSEAIDRVAGTAPQFQHGG